MHELSTMRDKAEIKVHQSNELAQLALKLGEWEITDSLHLVLKKGDATVVDVVTKEVQFFHTKKAFARIDDYSMLTEAFKHKLICCKWSSAEVLAIRGSSMYEYQKWSMQRTLSMNLWKVW